MAPMSDDTRLQSAEVHELATLARLDLSTAEIETLRGDLSEILTTFQQLRDVNTDGIEPMTHVVPVEHLRDDVATPSLSVDDALGHAGAPRVREDQFVVPHILPAGSND